VQYAPEPGAVAANLEHVESLLAARLSGNGHGAARLIVLPELSFVGPVQPAKIANFAEELHGPTARRVAALARRFQAHVVFGLPERSADGLFNTAVLIGPDGQQQGHARKLHLNRADRVWARAGQQFRVFQTERLGRVGILVGSDAYVSESGTLLAIERADLVAVPSSWYGELAGDGKIAIHPEIHPHARRNAMVLWDEMAWTHLYYVVVANFVGTSKRYLGRSGIYSIDPIYGIESPGLAKTPGDEIVVGTFQTLHGGDPDHWIDQQKYIASRRPDDLYYPLIRSRRSRRSPQPELVPAEAP
jgi:predicted amidohydrolase